MGKKNDERVLRILAAAAILSDGASRGSREASDDLDDLVNLTERAAALCSGQQRIVSAGKIALASSDELSMSRDSN